MNNMQRRKFADLFETRACMAFGDEEHARILQEKALKDRVEKALGITRLFAQIKKYENAIYDLKETIRKTGVDIGYKDEIRIEDKNGVFAIALENLKQKEMLPRRNLQLLKEQVLAEIWTCDNIHDLKTILINSRRHFPLEKKIE